MCVCVGGGGGGGGSGWEGKREGGRGAVITAKPGTDFS